MELKVWVDGVLRVVCGLSEETTCQEVVIALAQAIGQTGRYVLVQKLRDTERQLVADERPLETLSKLGQLSSDVHFILRRTGPSAGGSSGSGSISSNGSSTGPPPPPDRTTSLAQLPFPKHLNFEVPKRREPKKALTFNLGPSTAPHTRPKHFKKLPRDSPELRGSSPSPVPSPSRSPSSSPVPPHGSSSPSLPSKEEVFRQILQQQAELRALGEHLDSIQQEVWTWEQPPPPVLPPHLLEELDQLEEAMRRNRAELAHTIHWEDELKAEEEREDDLQRDAEELRRLLEEHTQRLDDRSGQLGHLEGALESTREETQRSQLRQAQVTQDSLDTVKAELDRRLREEAELTASLEQTDQDLDLAYRILQARTQELDELSKDLRQCNLQQFILQTGAPPPAAHHADGELLHISQLVEDSDADSEDSGQFSSESQPPLTARQILGDPRSARKPLVLTSRELPWQ